MKDCHTYTRRRPGCSRGRVAVAVFLLRVMTVAVTVALMATVTVRSSPSARVHIRTHTSFYVSSDTHAHTCRHIHHSGF
jgi:hypothetical protein